MKTPLTNTNKEKLKKEIYKKYRRCMANTSWPLYKLYWRVVKPKTYGTRMIVAHKESGDVMLVKSLNAKSWSLCGGGVKKSEDMKKAAIREVGEELGIAAKNIKNVFRLGVYRTIRRHRRYTTEIYVGETSQREVDIEWELDDARWFPKDNLPENLTKRAAQHIAEYLS